MRKFRAVETALFLLAMTLLLTVSVPAGEDKPVYKKVRFPRYKDNRIISELFAEEADAIEMTAGKTRININGVKVLVYDTSKPLDVNSDPDQAPPVKLVITGKRGCYEQIAGENGEPLKLSHIEEDVHVLRYEYPPDGGERVTTEIFCDNATWNSKSETLEGEGAVTIRQPGSVLRGNDFIYKLVRRDPADNSPLSFDRPNGFDQEPGGWFRLKRDVRMEFTQKLFALQPQEQIDGVKLPVLEPEPTVITCAGLAHLDLLKKQVQFQDKVVVVNRQDNMTMRSERLRVLMHKKASAPEERIREIIAWDNVFIDSAQADKNASFSARSEHAQYKTESGELILRSQKEGTDPSVEVDRNRVSAAVIAFNIREGDLDKLIAYGGRGRAVLMNAVLENQAGVKEKVDSPTVVLFDKDLNYDRANNRAIFSGNVRLARESEQMTMSSEKLLVELTPMNTANRKRSIDKMTAEENVRITQPSQQATAYRAEFDAKTQKTTLLGSPDGPPHPQIEQPGVAQFTAPKITVEQIENETGDKPHKLITGSGGPGSCVFMPQDKQKKAPMATLDVEVTPDVTASPDAVAIRYDDTMKYDTRDSHAQFTKNVVATTQEYVLRSNELHVLLTRTEDANREPHTEISRIAAMGAATLHWKQQHFEAERIVRDVQRKLITLYGEKDKPATVWEEGGKRFKSPRIIATEMGETVHAEGPGEMVVPDTNGVAVITYAENAIYTEYPDKTGTAKLRKDVRMRRLDNGMIVAGDEMDAVLEETPEAAVGADKGKLPRQLRKAVIRGHVKVTQGKQVAIGATGELHVNPAGDIVMLHGSGDRRAVVYDGKDIVLFSPSIKVVQSTGIIIADGPGEVRVNSAIKQALSHGAEGGGAAKQYLLYFDGRMTYNSLARKIKFEKNVRLKQANVYGNCDELTLLFADVPAGGGSDVRIDSLEAAGKVRFKRYVPAKFAREQEADPLLRYGKTVFTKSEQAFFDEETQTIKLYGGPPAPMAIQQTLDIVDNGETKCSRIQLQGETLELDLRDGDIKANPRPQIKYLKNTGPIEFQE